MVLAPCVLLGLSKHPVSYHIQSFNQLSLGISFSWQCQKQIFQKFVDPNFTNSDFDTKQQILLLNKTNRTYLKWVNDIIWVIAEVISTTRLPECKTNGTLPLDVQRKSLEQSLYKPRKHCNGGHPNMSDQIHICSKGLILVIKYQVPNQIMTPRLNVRQTWYPFQYWFN